MLLNFLRTVKVSANVGGALVGFVFPVKGGLVAELIEEALLLPAITMGVEAGTRFAVESYVNARKKEIVEKLRAEARLIAAQLYRDPLLVFSNAAMKKTGTFGVGKDLIERLPASLDVLRARLVTDNK